jgi:hypothetical protein
LALSPKHNIRNVEISVENRHCSQQLAFWRNIPERDIRGAREKSLSG